jgi:hypothetical protein
MQVILHLEWIGKMADITMCQDKECPKRDECYRFTAPANPYRQSFFIDSPREGDECKYFWMVEK